MGILCYLKKNNPNLKYFILDDSLETVQDVNFPYVYNSIDFFRFNKKHKILNSNFKINIIICHLNEITQNKILHFLKINIYKKFTSDITIKKLMKFYQYINFEFSKI